MQPLFLLLFLPRKCGFFWFVVTAAIGRSLRQLCFKLNRSAFSHLRVFWNFPIATNISHPATHTRVDSVLATSHLSICGSCFLLLHFRTRAMFQWPTVNFKCLSDACAHMRVQSGESLCYLFTQSSFRKLVYILSNDPAYEFCLY